MKKFIVILNLILPAFTVALSQEPPLSLKDTIGIDEVVITATRTAVNRSIVPLTVSVVSREKIENSSESALLPVLSEQVPGMFITRRGISGFGVASGSAGQISMRGIGGSPNTQVLVLVNGNPQFMGIMGHPMSDAYIASDVEKVEVIRGPASVLYGTNAMAGVINIITKEQSTDGIRANARMMYGSYDTRKYMVNGGYKNKGFSFFASFNRDRTDGHRDSSEFDINNAYFRAGYVISPELKITSDFSIAGFGAADPGRENMKAGSIVDVMRGMGAVALENTLGRLNGSARFFYNFGEHRINDGFQSHDRNFGILVYQSLRLFAGNSVTIGTDMKSYGGNAENTKIIDGNISILGDTAISEIAGYIYMQQEFFDKLTLNAGFRLEHNSVYGNEPVPTAGIAYRHSDKSTLKMSVSKGFRSPTIRELYLWAPANSALEPERMMSYEAGAVQKLASNRISLELTLFMAEGKNLIQTVTGDHGPENRNTGSFSNRGIEFSGTFRPSSCFSINASYSRLAMKVPVLAAPEQQLFINCAYKLKKITFNLSAEHIRDLYTRLIPAEERNSYMLLNSRISYSINRHIGLFVKSENLTNSKYYINYGYPMPGIIAFTGINLQY